MIHSDDILHFRVFERKHKLSFLGIFRGFISILSIVRDVLRIFRSFSATLLKNLPKLLSSFFIFNLLSHQNADPIQGLKYEMRLLFSVRHFKFDIDYFLVTFQVATYFQLTRCEFTKNVNKSVLLQAQSKCFSVSDFEKYDMQCFDEIFDSK